MITMDENNKYIQTKDSVRMYSGASAILSNATMLFLKVLQNKEMMSTSLLAHRLYMEICIFDVMQI